MTCPFCRRTVLAVVLLPAALVAVVSPSVVLAQAPAAQTVQAPPVTRTETRDDDDSGKWGLPRPPGARRLGWSPAPGQTAIGHRGR
jgi:hypothetical protein